MSQSSQPASTFRTSHNLSCRAVTGWPIRPIPKIFHPSQQAPTEPPGVRQPAIRVVQDNRIGGMALTPGRGVGDQVDLDAVGVLDKRALVRAISPLGQSMMERGDDLSHGGNQRRDGREGLRPRVIADA